MTDEKDKPVLDEQTFSRLIEAAYVLQEHNRAMQSLENSLEAHSERLRQQEAEEAALPAAGTDAPTAEPETSRESDYTLTLAEIVEAQHQIQIRHLEKDDAMGFVAERIMRIAKASGAGIAILEESTVRYRAGAGAPALPVGTETTLKTAICATCLRTGQVLRTPDVNTEFLFDPDLCRSRGIFSMVAVPVYHNGEIVGALELYFEKLNGYHEQDIHTCQLMAGLVTEAIGRDSETSLKKSIAAERSSMLAAIERLKPSLASMADDAPPVATAAEEGATSLSVSVCWKCGNRLVPEEPYCGTCGAPSVGDVDPADFHGTVESMWQTISAEEAARTLPGTGVSTGESSALALRAAAATASPADQPQADLFSATQLQSAHATFATTGASASEGDEIVHQFRAGELASDASPDKLIPSANDGTWTSASNAKEFLEALSGTSSVKRVLARFWHARRGDFYLAIALLLVALVIRWGIVSTRSANATGAAPGVAGKNSRRKPAADANLSAFDRFLISVGLAEAEPEAADYKGNPNTQVWIDLHTALYYCPGSELYGKSAKGKFASQRDAQLDQFQPASRQTCE